LLNRGGNLRGDWWSVESDRYPGDISASVPDICGTQGLGKVLTVKLSAKVESHGVGVG